MKTVLPWILVVALLGGAFYLYSAGQSKEAELARLRQDNADLDKLRDENDALKKGAVSPEELTRLRKDNEEVLRLRGEVRRLLDQGRDLTNQFQLLVRNQSARQQQLSAENETLRSQNQQITDATAKAASDALAAACVNNLRLIDAAKQAFATASNKPAGYLPTAADLLPYLPQGTMPTCPGGGVYTINVINTPPTCSIPGHTPGQ
jgi:hypothetical protein